MLREDDPPPLPHLMQHSPYNARHTNTSPRYHNDDDDDADDNHNDGDCENKFLFFEAFSLNFPREKNIDKGFFFSFLVVFFDCRLSVFF